MSLSSEIINFIIGNALLKGNQKIEMNFIQKSLMMGLFKIVTTQYPLSLDKKEIMNYIIYF